MQAIDIVLIVTGLFLIMVSYIISERATGMNEETIEVTPMSDDFMKEELKMQLTKLARVAYEETEENLSRLSNEKIMAVTDYSDQILEKIESNHSEVVFLYNMLNDKEEELKQFMQSGVKIAKPEVKEEVQQQPVKKKVPQKNKKNTKNSQKDDSKAVRTEDIISMYEKGMSIGDISRELNMGQGEVQLILTLSSVGGSHE